MSEYNQALINAAASLVQHGVTDQDGSVTLGGVQRDDLVAVGRADFERLAGVLDPTADPQGTGYQEDRYREAMYDGESGTIDRADHLRLICEEARRDDPEADLVAVPAEDVYWLVCAYEETLRA